MFMEVEHATFVAWVWMREANGCGNITEFVEKCIEDPVARKRVIAAIRKWEKKFQAQTRA